MAGHHRLTQGAFRRKLDGVAREHRVCPHCGGEIGGRLMDCRTIIEELGVSRSSAEWIMRAVPKVEFKGLRKCYVKREDIERLIADSTVDIYAQPPVRSPYRRL
jgi:hypothetical protein